MKSFKYLQIAILLLVFIFPMKGFAQEKKLIEKASFSIQEAKQHTAQVSQLEVNALIAKTFDSYERINSVDGSVVAITKKSAIGEDGSYRYNTTFVDENGNHLGAFNNWDGGLLLPSSDGKHFVLAQIGGDILEFYDFTTSRLLVRHELSWLDKIAFSRDGSRLLAKGSSGHKVFLHCFTSNGEELWTSEFPYLSFGKIAINYDGSYAAFESIVYDPQRIEMLQEKEQERKEIYDRAHEEWLETNRERRKQGLPLVKFVPPELSQKEWPINPAVGPGSHAPKAIIFVDRNGEEIGRTPTRKQLVKNLTFSNDGGSNFVASVGWEIILFDAAKAQELHKIKIPNTNDPISLDVNKNGDIAIGSKVYEHGQESQFKILLYKSSSSELRTYLLSGDQRTLKRPYGVSFGSSNDKILVQTGEQIIVLQMDENEK